MRAGQLQRFLYCSIPVMFLVLMMVEVPRIGLDLDPPQVSKRASQPGIISGKSSPTTALQNSTLATTLKEHEDVVVNNFGMNQGLRMQKDRQKDADMSELKYILFWNEAYGTKEYDIGFGRKQFYKNLCPETRCVTTADRTLLEDVSEFDAILFHQRSLDWKDIPKKSQRRPEQRYIHYIMESAQYLYMDIRQMDGFFNWTMTYKADSDFRKPYGRIVKVKSHPEGDELKKYIEKFGKENVHLAKTKKTGPSAAWFVSHCATQARREMYAKRLKKYMTVDIYGKCGSLRCSRKNETECYQMAAEKYHFYLSFENSVCVDYVTEKFFNPMKYNMIPVTYNGANMSAIAPPHSYINVLDYKTVSDLAQYLEKVANDPALYASYFWWKDFYQVRNELGDLNQAFCELCSALHSNKEEKVYTDLVTWWVKNSSCKKLKLI